MMKKKLLNKELSFLALDNIMQENGYYSETDHTESEIEDILKSGSIVYTKDDDSHTVIHFVCTIPADATESILASYVKITDVI